MSSLVSLKLDLSKLIVEAPDSDCESPVKSDPDKSEPPVIEQVVITDRTGDSSKNIPKQPPKGNVASTSANTTPRKRHVVEPKQYKMTDELTDAVEEKELLSKHWKIDTGNKEDQAASMSRRLMGKPALKVTSPRARKDPSRGAENNHRQPMKQQSVVKAIADSRNKANRSKTALSLEDDDNDEIDNNKSHNLSEEGDGEQMKKFEQFEVELKSTFGEAGIPISAHTVVYSKASLRKDQVQEQVPLKDKNGIDGIIEDPLAVTSYNQNVTALSKGTQIQQEKVKNENVSSDIIPLNTNLQILKLDDGTNGGSSEYNLDALETALETAPLGVTNTTLIHNNTKIGPVYSKTSKGKHNQTFDESPVYIKQLPIEFAGNGRSMVLKSFEAKGCPTKGSMTPVVVLDKETEGANNKTTMYSKYGLGSDIAELIDSPASGGDGNDKKSASSKIKQVERIEKLRDLKKSTVNFMEYRSTCVDQAEPLRKSVRGNKLKYDVHNSRIGLKTPVGVRLDPELVKEREILNETDAKFIQQEYSRTSQSTKAHEAFTEAIAQADAASKIQMLGSIGAILGTDKVDTTTKNQVKNENNNKPAMNNNNKEEDQSFVRTGRDKLLAMRYYDGVTPESPLYNVQLGIVGSVAHHIAVQATLAILDAFDATNDINSGESNESILSKASKLAELTLEETHEIKKYNTVYYVGERDRKIDIEERAENDIPKENIYNRGFDDSRGNYLIGKSDHLAYRYEVTDILGTGSFSAVYNCIDHKTSQECAIKIIRNKKTLKKQANLEVEILYLLGQNPYGHCIELQSHFKFRSHTCMVFPVYKMNLFQYLKSKDFSGCSMSVVRKITSQLLTCLSYLRSSGVVHCDIKPENILIKDENTMEITLADFGSAQFCGKMHYSYVQSRFYRAPEVLLSFKEVDIDDLDKEESKQPDTNRGENIVLNDCSTDSDSDNEKQTKKKVLPKKKQKYHYSYPMDIWSLAVMLPELRLGFPSFPGESEIDQLALVSELLGTPPPNLFEMCSRKKVFFTNNGGSIGDGFKDNKGNFSLKGYTTSKGTKREVGSRSVHELVKARQTRGDVAFVSFLEAILQWDPDLRITPDVAIRHEFIVGGQKEKEREKEGGRAKSTKSNVKTTRAK